MRIDLMTRLGALATAGALASAAHACPFCAELATKTPLEEIAEGDAAVLASLADAETDGAARVLQRLKGAPETQRSQGSRFSVAEILVEGPGVTAGQEVTSPFPVRGAPGSLHLLVRKGTKSEAAWSAPVPVSREGATFFRKALALPARPPAPPEGSPPPDPAPVVERLAFFQDFLTHPEPAVASSAYAEFAKSPYPAVLALGPRMNRQALLDSLADERTGTSVKRLQLTLLGVCGQPEDVAFVEEWMRAPRRRKAVGADALIACYLCLAGEAGLPLVNRLFLEPDAVEQTEVFATRGALQFHLDEADVIPDEPLRDSFRLFLDQPKLADLAIPDLAKLEDWDSLPRIIELYRLHAVEFPWLKRPALAFLQACPLPEAKTALEEFAPGIQPRQP